MFYKAFLESTNIDLSKKTALADKTGIEIFMYRIRSQD
jgi:hypothetical protein